MKKAFRLLLIFFFLTGCNLPEASTVPSPEIQLATLTPIPTPIPTPTPTSTPEPVNADAQYFDDFSKSWSGWARIEDAETRFAYVEEEYLIRIEEQAYYSFVATSEKFSDGILKADLRHISGDDELTGSMILWRYFDEENYYALTITDDGQYSIHRFVDGAFGLIKIPTYTPFLNTTGEKNQVTVVFNQEFSDIFINDQFVFSFRDPSLLLGSVGMGASPDISSAVEVAFDNLTVFKYSPKNSFIPDKPQPTSIPSYRPINWKELTDFLTNDHTNWNEYDLKTYNCVDYAIDLAENARQQNIKVRIVGVDFLDQELGHAFVEFETYDKGIIFVEPQGDNTYSNVEIGHSLCDDWGKAECMGIITNIEYFSECDHQHRCAVYLP